MVRPVPGWLFPPLFFAGVAVLLAGGIQYQVGRKERTSFNDQVYIEDSSIGNSTRYRVLVGKDDTAGDFFTIEVLMRAEAYGYIRDKPGSEEPHYHQQQEERVKVKQGKLGYFIGHQTHVKAAEADEEVVIKAGESHMLFNAGGGANGTDLLLEVTFTPARHGEQLFETLAGLGHDYESVLAVSPIQKWMTLGQGEVVLSEMPPAVWDLVQRWLVPMAKKLGYKAFYPQYRTKRHYSRRSGQFEEDEGEAEDREEGLGDFDQAE